jgi:hypothetical protein
MTFMAIVRNIALNRRQAEQEKQFRCRVSVVCPIMSKRHRRQKVFEDNF